MCRRPAHAVWAIDADWCREAANAKLGKTETTDFLQQNGDAGSHEQFERFLDTQELTAYPVNPFRLNERVVAQQAVFLCPGNVEESFDDNLANMNPPPHKIICIRIGPQTREEFIKELERMNISRAVLFPGLEGFATSLKLWMCNYERLHTKLPD